MVHARVAMHSSTEIIFEKCGLPTEDLVPCPLMFRQLVGQRHIEDGILFLGAAILVVSTACQTPSGGRTDNAAPTRIDRLVQRHPELRAGRFAVIADFEDDAQLELFHVENVSGGARWSIKEPSRGTEELGRRLVFRSGLPADSLCIGDDRATKWHLKRDWREYDLLMFDVESPQDGLRLELTVSADEPREARTRSTTIRLAKGPNPIRLDLAELSEHLPLDDIRELRLSLPDSTDPTEVILNDMVLTADRETMLAPSSGSAGSLYVERTGRRWIVGSIDRFELTFAHGQIVAWYNLTGDPQRLHNLVSGTTLGPTVQWSKGKSPASSGHRLRSSLSITSALIEANALRAVIETRAQSANGSTAKPGESDVDQRRYTIYPTGHVFVTMSVGMPRGIDGSDRPSRPSLAVHVADGSENPAEVFPGTNGTPSDNASLSSDLPFGLITLSTARASLLFALHGLGDSVITSERLGAGGKTISLLATPNDPPTNPFHCAAMLVVGGNGGLSRDDAKALARWFVDPPRIEPTVGAIAPMASGVAALAAGGFDRGSGAYRLQPTDGTVRFTLPAHPQDQREPTFVISGTKDRQPWVYGFSPPSIETPKATSCFRCPSTRRKRPSLRFS